MNIINNTLRILAVLLVLAAAGTVRADDTKALADTTAKPATVAAKKTRMSAKKSEKAEKTEKNAKSEMPSVVNINTANAEQLATLPGVGPAIAARIVTYRSENGNFKEVSQLLEVKGIGEKKLAQLRPNVTID